MEHNDRNYFIRLAYALLSLSKHMKTGSLREGLERESVALLRLTTLTRMKDAERHLLVLEKLLLLGEMVGEVSYEESRAFHKTLSEARSFLNFQHNQAITLLPDSHNLQLPDFVPSTEFLKKNDSIESAHELDDKRNKNDSSEMHQKQTNRIERIAEKIRQSGNLAMKDISAAFPDVSERTLRYDLQRLLERGTIERVGNGGPSSFYKVRDSRSINEMMFSPPTPFSIEKGM